jgi:hypothetical protein
VVEPEDLSLVNEDVVPIRFFVCSNCGDRREERYLASRFGKPQRVGTLPNGSRLLEATCSCQQARPKGSMEPIWKEVTT